ncbi:MAG: hypothetical protein R2912_02315 [Eubacteriales bacterium]
MFVMDYDEGQGWHVTDALFPYGDILISPASSVLHYAQMMFEGMKAYKTASGTYCSFAEMNARRLNRTNERICMPQMDEELFVSA